VLVSYKGTVAAQMTQMRQAIQQGETNGTNNYNSLNSRLNGMAGVISAIEAYNMTCSTYLTGPNGGPATFYFACSEVKPGS
jgi:hypothetical protein